MTSSITLDMPLTSHLHLSFRKFRLSHSTLLSYRTSEEFTILGQLAAESDNNLGGYNPPDYDIAYDWYGPEYFFPPQCVRQTSWAIPKRGSPIIAIIDDEDNPSVYSEDIY